MAHRILRQAGALILIFVIGVFVFLKPSAVFGASRAIIKSQISAECGLPKSSSLIKIANYAYEIESNVSISKNPNVVGRQRSIKSYGLDKCHTAQQSESAKVKLALLRRTQIIIWRALRELLSERNHECFEGNKIDESRTASKNSLCPI